MSVRKVIMFEVRCDVCDEQLRDAYGEALLWPGRDAAVGYLTGPPYWAVEGWVGLSDGGAFCTAHADRTPHEQTGPDLFEAVA